ncbi:MAG: c-type cytochrome [Ilumatobacteraceae bacterium]
MTDRSHTRSHHLAQLVPTALRVGVVAALIGALGAACAANGTEVSLSPAAEAGREITRTNGCSACHGRSGEGGPGPAFVGLFGSTVEFRDGSTAIADEAYLAESIREPSARIVAGYGFPMPDNDLTDDEIQSVIAYLRELPPVDEVDG